VIGSYFSHHRLVTIPNAGHWVHAESPRLFLEAVQAFLD
jgi:esterase